MNKYWSALLILAACLGCAQKSEKKQTDNYSGVDKNAPAEKIIGPSDTIKINIARSSIHWTGTKMRTTGKHEGTVSFENGYILMCNGIPSGGIFIVNMRSIAVTDIPLTDPIPIKKLTDHLQGEDFFDTDHYSTATLKILNTEMIYGHLQAKGLLTIKNITKPVLLEVTMNKNNLFSTLTFNRFEWNVGYADSWADRTLVDAEVRLKIKISIP